MNQLQTTFKRLGLFFLATLFALIALYWAYGNQRWTSLTVALVVCLSQLFPRTRPDRKRFAQLAVIWGLISCSPLEVSLYTSDRGPMIARVVPCIISGQPTSVGLDPNAPVICTGDVVGGMEPKWVVVW